MLGAQEQDVPISIAVNSGGKLTMSNLAVKYRPKTWDDVSEQSIVVDMLKKMCEADTITNRNFLLIGPAGCGKANPLYTKILTPTGYVTMGDIQVGVNVFTSRGGIAKVSGVYPQGEKDIYRIHLSDNTHIDVSDEHINVVYTYDSNTGKRTDMEIETKDLIELFKTSKTPLRVDAPALSWNHNPSATVSPYLIGALLGSMSNTEPLVLHNLQDDVANRISKLLRVHYHHRLARIDATTSFTIVADTRYQAKNIYTFNGTDYYGCYELADALWEAGYPRCTHKTVAKMFTHPESSRMLKHFPELKEIGCRPAKNEICAEGRVRLNLLLQLLGLTAEDQTARRHVPECYLYNDCRIPLIQGLFDTCGKIGADGTTQFVTEFAALSESFAFAARSLGCIDSVNCNKNGKFTHTVKFPKYFKFFTSKEHEYNYKPRKFNIYRSITDIEYIGKQPCQCIMVDAPEHTYICENGMIPTHNTTSARILASDINKGKGEPIEIDAASHNGVDSVREIVQQARSYPVGCDWKVFIIDECFHKDTLISTPAGQKRICEFKPGDDVCNMTGSAKVKNVFKNTVPASHLVLVHLDSGHDILTTTNHLFFTDDGWVAAKDLVKGKALYDPHTMQAVLSNVLTNTIQPTSCSNAEAGEQLEIPEIEVSECYRDRKTSNSNCYQVRVSPSVSSCDRDFCEVAARVRGDRSSSICQVRVQSVEVYEPDRNEASFSRYFSCEELHADFVDMYDLEVEGHPSYYAEGILVHNCHTFSTSAWQVLLKTLEEGPAKSIFILCTTNPEKIPATILSRVQTFQLSKISLDGIKKRLIHVLECEKAEGRHIEYTDDAVGFIAKMANGGMRDSLTLLDKALAYSENITSENLSKALDLPNYEDFFALLNAYAKKDNTQIAAIIHRVYNSGANFIKWFESWHAFVVNVLKYIFLQDINATMIPSYYQDKISKYGPAHAVICLKLANTLVKLNHELKSTQYLQELALTYLCSYPKKGA